MNANHGLPLIRPKIAPVLDSAFSPAVLANRAYRANIEKAAAPVQIALERADGSVSRFNTSIARANTPQAAGNFVYIERLLKFFLWSRGGYKIHFSGPAELARALQQHYRESATGRFDAGIMGERIYEK